MQAKADIRKEVLQRRNQLTAKELESKSFAIYDQLKLLDIYKQASVIYVYMDFKNEVITKHMIEDALCDGKKVAIPKIIDDIMDFYYIDDIENLKSGYFGIREPEPIMLAKEKNSLMIIPGVAFDKKGHRIGYGKGFYDRFLHQHEQFKKVALAFELQVLDTIPHETHDVLMDRIITEERIIIVNSTMK